MTDDGMGCLPGFYAAGYRQVWRVCSDGYRTRVWEKIVPRIDDSILNCGIYLYGSEEDAKRGEPYGGSGFLVGVPFGNRPPNTAWHCYAVTNAHVVKGGYPVVRVNTNEFVNAGAKVHQWAGMKMHQWEGQWESWFDFWQGEREGDFPLAIAANI
jgi:hypothetical protein